MSRGLRVGILGFGEVARALAQELSRRRDITVVAVADRSGGVLDPDLPKILSRKAATGSIGGDPARDAEWIANEAEIDALVDLLPTDLRTAEPSRALQRAALARGVAVVTANKGVLAIHPRDAAVGSYHASGAVAGGTPILELVANAFRGDTLERFDAVLNGSTNFILSRLEEGERWEAAVEEARRRGILEADPSLDLLGLDAAAKATILANAAWGLDRTLADAKTQGIMGVTAREAQEARANGLAIRLVARGSREGVSVAPVALPRDHPLVVDGKENAIRLKLTNAGTIVLRGAGAGGAETASAVLSDILSLTRPARPVVPKARPESAETRIPRIVL